jgi:hypothetical protein
LKKKEFSYQQVQENPISLRNRISDALKIFEKDNLFFGFPLKQT